MERRQQDRYRVSLPAFVRIVAEEETFTPYQYENAHLHDLSTSGAMIVIAGMSSEEYDVLFRRPRYLRIQCKFPKAERATLLFGRVFWHEFLDEDEPPVCRAAVSFEPLRETKIDELERLLKEAGELT